MITSPPQLPRRTRAVSFHRAVPELSIAGRGWSRKFRWHHALATVLRESAVIPTCLASTIPVGPERAKLPSTHQCNVMCYKHARDVDNSAGYVAGTGTWA